MTKEENANHLPGSRLRQFADKYFEQPGLERIALPIIADLQREYSYWPHSSWKRFFILLRGYLSFWKAIVLYSFFSDEGNIRIFKSIGFLRLLGAVVGVTVSVISWKGNQTPGRVSLFPDASTAFILLCLYCLAVLFCARQTQARGFSDVWRISGKISLPIGIILWMVNILLVYKLWRMTPDAFTFLVTSIAVSGIVVVYRLIVSLMVRCVFAVSKSMKTI